MIIMIFFQLKQAKILATVLRNTSPICTSQLDTCRQPPWAELPCLNC